MIIDVVILSRVQEVFESIFKKFLPNRTLEAFFELVENRLGVVEEQRQVLKWVDLDRLMDYSITLYLRFNHLQHEHPMKSLFLAMTVFSIDYIEFD